MTTKPLSETHPSLSFNSHLFKRNFSDVNFKLETCCKASDVQKHTLDKKVVRDVIRSVAKEMHGEHLLNDESDELGAVWHRLGLDATDETVTKDGE